MDSLKNLKIRAKRRLDLDRYGYIAIKNWLILSIKTKAIKKNPNLNGVKSMIMTARVLDCGIVISQYISKAMKVGY